MPRQRKPAAKPEGKQEKPKNTESIEKYIYKSERLRARQGQVVEIPGISKSTCGTGEQMAAAKPSDDPITEIISTIEDKDSKTMAILSAIKELGKNMDEKFSVVDGRMTNIETKMKSWEQSMEQRLTATETAQKKATSEINDFKTTIDFMEKTAKETKEITGEIDNTFEAVAEHIRSERIATVKDYIALEDRLNTLERENKARNIRVQGLSLTDSSNLKAVVHDTFRKVLPSLKKAQIDYVVKIKIRGLRDSSEEQAIAEQNGAESREVPSLALVRFVDKKIRNQVFSAARKNKQKFDKKIIVREDMIRSDYENWKLAKPQMQEAYANGLKSSCKFGTLYIDSKKTSIEGAQTENMRIEQAGKESTLQRPSIKKT